MNLDRFRATWTGLTLENHINRIVILVLIGANIALAISLNQTERTVVLVPPVLEGEITVARSSASQEVKVSGPAAKPVPGHRVHELPSGGGLPGCLSGGAAHWAERWGCPMTPRPLLMALILSLAAAGAGHTADDRDPDIASTATPRVSCDLLAIRADAPRATSTAASANPKGGGPAIRRVGGRGTFPTGNGDFLKVGLGPGQVMPAARELGPHTVSVPLGTTALVEIAIDHRNRIVTPFQNPVLHTVSPASTSVDGRVVYVATATEEPVALYIGDGPWARLGLWRGAWSWASPQRTETAMSSR